MKNLIWFVIAAAILVVAFVLRAPYVAYALYAFLLLVFLANFSSRAWLSGLDCTRELSGNAFQQGDNLTVVVTVRNRRGWPIPWIYLEDQYPAFCALGGENARLAALMPGREVRLRYRLTLPKRGYHRIGPMMMESGDLFGLQKRFRTGVQQDYVTVLPSIAYIETFAVSSKRPQGPVRTKSRIYEDPSRLHGMREYQLGDPLNRISWKTTARTGKLYTKTFDPTTVSGGTLLLDMHADSYRPEKVEARQELAITTAASIAYLLQMSGEQVGLITNAVDAAEVARYEVDSRGALSREEIAAAIAEEQRSERLQPLRVPTLRSPDQSQIIAENLARVLPGYGLDCVDLLMEEFRGLPRDAALLPIVPQVTEQFALALAEMKLNGFNVSVFLIRDRAAYDTAAALLAPHHIHVFHIREERDLHELAPQKIGQ